MTRLCNASGFREQKQARSPRRHIRFRRTSQRAVYSCNEKFFVQCDVCDVYEVKLDLWKTQEKRHKQGLAPDPGPRPARAHHPLCPKSRDNKRRQQAQPDSSSHQVSLFNQVQSLREFTFTFLTLTTHSHARTFISGNKKVHMQGYTRS